MRLDLTSTLFGTVVVHAYYARAEIYHHLFLLLTMTSIMFHATRASWVHNVVAHVCFISVVVLDTAMALSIMPTLLLFPTGCACLWLAERVLPRGGEVLHVALHLLGAFGMHCLLAILY